MAPLPEFRLIGSPVKIKVRGVPIATYYQHYRLPPDRKVKRAPCCRDKQLSQRRAVKYVEAHIKKQLAKTDSIVACANATIAEHLEVYKQSLQADGRSPKYIKLTSRRIERICKAWGWKAVAEIDGLKVKNWLSRQKLSQLTRRYYTVAVKGFTNFLAVNRRIKHDPLRYLKTRIKGVDDPKPTRIRRALTPAEITRLVRAARTSTVRAEGLTGEQRVWLYQVAVSTGFRASELSSLVAGSFSLDEAVVLLERSVSKRRRYDRQELPQVLVDGLRGWLAGLPPDQRLWPSFWRNRAARMLRIDLKAAKIDVVDDKGAVVDFHSLRVTYITNLCGYCTHDLVLIQRLSRLSTVALLNRYVKQHDSQRVAAVAKLPTLEVPV